MAKSPVKLTSAQETTHVVFIIDRSSSMAHLRDDVVRVFNKQAADHREQSNKFNQNTRVSLLTFATGVDEPLFWDEDIKHLGDLVSSSYVPSGSTALYDAVAYALNALTHSTANAFLLVILTDGEENNSHIGADALGKLIQKANATDKYTITFLVPQNADLSRLYTLGLYGGNIEKWETTRRGIEKADIILRTSTVDYYGARSRGFTSSKSFFSPNVANLNKTKIKKSLMDVTGQFKYLPVIQRWDGREIRDFVEANRITYSKGAAFYQLTKKETVQGDKEFIIRSKFDNKIYLGDTNARLLLGLPVGGTVQLGPSFHPDYDIFVQSNSVNRHLVAGTTVLYRVF